MLRASGVRVVLADGHLPEELRAAASDAGARLRIPRLDARLCAIASEEFPAMGVDALAPIYPREPEAVTKWRERATGQRQ